MVLAPSLPQSFNSKVIRLAIDQPVSDDLFMAQMTEGLEVVDQTQTPALRYRYKKP